MKKVHSPITGNDNTRLLDTINTKLIIRQYLEDLNIDVSRFFKEDKVSIYECLSTGFRFYYPFDIDGDSKLYEDLQKRENYYGRWHWQHDVVNKLIKKGDKVLEVGCGIGSFMERLKKNNIEVYGLELNNEAVKVCNNKGLTVYNELLDQHLKSKNNYYDLVCSFQVLEHIAVPKTFIAENIEAAKRGGKVVFSVPNNNPYVYKRDKYHTLNMPPHHMGLWSVGAFKRIPNYFNIALKEIAVQDINEQRYYLNTFLRYNNLSFIKPFADKFPNSVINKIAKLRNWQGRNIVAVFEKV